VASLRNYAIILAAYWGFTLTDGALRMLVLLHFYKLGYTPFQLAFLFVLYELCGVLTNLLGGWVGSRIGLKATLSAGLGLQVVSLVMLSLLDPAWSVITSVAYVVLAQGLAGIAKDLTKTSSKSSIKLFVPEDSHSLVFRWVSILTGSKNALKGVGFFLGGAMLAGLGFADSLRAMAVALVVVFAAVIFLLPSHLGRSKAKVKFTRIFAKSPEINQLSAARFFLFGARDVWFVVGVPIFLYTQVGWTFVQVSGFLAAWTIGYGVVQGIAPSFVRRSRDGRSTETRAARAWALVLAAVPWTIIVAIRAGVDPGASIVIGLGIFGFVFAVNSSVHSYLVLAYTDADKVALNVGFYYMANSGGRLVGTLLSGIVYQWGGLSGCLITASLLVVASWLMTLALPTRGFEGLVAPVGAVPESD
jgi:MFS family permease